MAKYFRTNIFSVEPVALSDSENLKQMYGLTSESDISSVDFPLYNVRIFYLRTQECESPEAELYPSVHNMLKQLGGILSHNKVVMDYDRENGYLYLAIGEGKNRLLLANAYRAEDFMTAFYYLNLAVNQVLFNPQLTAVYLMSELKIEEVELIEKYYQKCIRL